jgi:hypothetical protein
MSRSSAKQALQRQDEAVEYETYSAVEGVDLDHYRHQQIARAALKGAVMTEESTS